MQLCIFFNKGIIKHEIDTFYTILLQELHKNVPLQDDKTNKEKEIMITSRIIFTFQKKNISLYISHFVQDEDSDVHIKIVTIQ